MSVVVDSSVVLAVLRNEEGSERALPALADGHLSSVNAAEIVTRLIDLGYEPDRAVSTLSRTRLSVVPFDEELALLAGRLRTVTRHRGLSLGDRACLALAIREKATALTADRNWAELDLPCKVELIR
ncbi:type II toxin-antitoxin system VapC family toxin [Hoeflea sp. G2-23]|uniref:Type II toxin-antitoxin system VapC family toxin n=1 Tax=Hoeflea algicola TaxID=2983763 RepID=A0ABT3Z7N9_9HYPH|nr:type II toxin-antitoxin system VapC family toxin [Hoeflea algicola]MCY0147773.1 type II toxin-antitoxin system VapC family toxin [Hoeflea algicola]